MHLSLGKENLQIGEERGGGEWIHICSFLLGIGYCLGPVLIQDN